MKPQPPSAAQSAELAALVEALATNTAQGAAWMAALEQQLASNAAANAAQLGALTQALAANTTGDVSGVAALEQQLATNAGASATLRAALQGALALNAAGDAGEAARVTAALNRYGPAAYLGLVRNGSGLQGNNDNFSQCGFDPTILVSGGGSFTSTVWNHSIFCDDVIAINPNSSYRLRMNVRGEGQEQSLFYAGTASYDIDGLMIEAVNWYYIGGTLTTLTADLNPGDPTVQVASTANWVNWDAPIHMRSLIFWNYRNAKGCLYPPETYSRNWYGYKWLPGGITPGVITLAAPWDGPFIPAGTPVSNGSAGGTYQYSLAAALTLPPSGAWVPLSTTMGGVNYGAAPHNFSFPPGTASIKTLVLANLGMPTPPANAKTWINMISIVEIP